MLTAQISQDWQKKMVIDAILKEYPKATGFQFSCGFNRTEWNDSPNLSPYFHCDFIEETSAYQAYVHKDGIDFNYQGELCQEYQVSGQFYFLTKELTFQEMLVNVVKVHAVAGYNDGGHIRLIHWNITCQEDWKRLKKQCPNSEKRLIFYYPDGKTAAESVF